MSLRSSFASNSKINELFAKPSTVALTIGSILIRLLPHPPNFTPLGATALFAGVKLERPWNYLTPLFILFVTDLFLGFHSTMPYVYGSFILSVFLAERFLKQSVTTQKLVVFATANSFIFFLITNFGVWMEGRLYPLTTTGLIQSYVMALPFLRNMLSADLVFTLGFFGLFAWARRISALRRIDSQLSNWLLKSDISN